MKKNVFLALCFVVVIAFFIAVAMVVNPSTPTIKGDVFDVRDWNHPEYVEKWTQTVQGTVIKEMTPKVKNQFDCIIEVKDDSTSSYLLYFVDTVRHPVGEVTKELVGVNIGSYNYEESPDMVRQLAVVLSMNIVNNTELK